MFRLSCIILLFFSLVGNATTQTNRYVLMEEYHRLDSICEQQKNNNPEILLEESKKMLEIARQLQVDTLILYANMLQGQALDFLGLYDAALKIDYENLSFAEQTQHCYYQVKSAILIGRVHQIMGNPEKSQEFTRKGKQYAIACGLHEDTIALNYDIGFNMATMGDFDGGIQLIEENLKAAKQIGDKQFILFGIDNLSNLLAEAGHIQKSLEYELELLKIPGMLDNNLDKAQVYEHLAEIYVLLKDWNNAQKYQREALKYAKLANLNDWIYECYKLQSAIDEARGDYKSALKNHRIYLELKDSVYQTEYEGKMAAMSALYDLESKQKAISLLEKDRQIKDGQIRQQRILLLLGLLSLVVIVLAIRFLHHRKTEKLREAFAQDLIKVQEQERQRISKELHDSVGQNILFIKNRLQRFSPEPDFQLINSLDMALEEVRMIAKDLYPNQLEAHGLSSAVDTLCELARESSGIFISSDLQGIDENLNKEAKINCYRIIQECINNTMKHAEATAIRVSSSLKPGKVELVVQDNGIGFDKTLLLRKSARSFGMINMEERVKMLRGKFELETAANKGVKLTFSIPV